MTERFIVIDEGLDFMIRDTITGDDLIDADGVADVMNDYEKENEQLKLKLHIWENVAYMLDQEVNRAMEEGFEISEWYKNHLAKGPMIS